MSDGARAADDRALRLLVFTLASLPAAQLIQDYAGGELARPFATMIRETGFWSMRFLVLALCLSPLAVLTGVAAFNGLRRMIGLFGAFYAAFHLVAWARQYEFAWPFLIEEATLRFYLALGLGAVVLLIPLAATSPAAMHRALGSVTWRRLHLLMYPIVAAALLHFALARGMRRAEVALDLLALVFCVAYRVGRR